MVNNHLDHVKMILKMILIFLNMRNMKQLQRILSKYGEDDQMGDLNIRINRLKIQERNFERGVEEI